MAEPLGGAEFRDLQNSGRISDASGSSDATLMPLRQSASSSFGSVKRETVINERAFLVPKASASAGAAMTSTSNLYD